MSKYTELNIMKLLFHIIVFANESKTVVCTLREVSKLLQRVCEYKAQ